MVKLTKTDRMSLNILIVLKEGRKMIFYDGGAAPNARGLGCFFLRRM